MRPPRSTTTGVLAALAAIAFATTAAAQPSSLGEQLFGGPSDGRARPMPPVARFVPEDGDAFVLDRSIGRQVFLRFENSPEIWALTPIPAPRGDVIYKDDMGETVLRATKLGGVTLFTPERPGGVAAAMAGQGAALRPPVIASATQLLQTFLQATERAQKAARVGHPITFDLETVPLSVGSLFADAAAVTAEAFVEMASRGERARRSLGRFTSVRFSLGPEPMVSIYGETLNITVAPDRGLAGRPSSRRIEAALKR